MTTDKREYTPEVIAGAKGILLNHFRQTLGKIFDLPERKIREMAAETSLTPKVLETAADIAAAMDLADGNKKMASFFIASHRVEAEPALAAYGDELSRLALALIGHYEEGVRDAELSS